jgi:hypothetical protein
VGNAVRFGGRFYYFRHHLYGKGGLTVAVIVCPWCQSEIPRAEGQEPDKRCPVCDNELGGYRTVRVRLDRTAEEEADAAEEDVPADPGEEAIDWPEDGEWGEREEELLQLEETVERLLDGQENAPECPQCHEYMLETGEWTVQPGEFRPRMTQALGMPVLPVPFAVTTYLCPSCFTVHLALDETSRIEVIRRLSRPSAPSERKPRS